MVLKNEKVKKTFNCLNLKRPKIMKFIPINFPYATKTYNASQVFKLHSLIDRSEALIYQISPYKES